MNLIGFLASLMALAVRSTRLVWVDWALAVFGTLAEFAALSSLIPLSQQLNHSKPSVVGQAWLAALQALGLAPSAKLLFVVFFGMLMLRIVLQFAHSVLTAYLARRIQALLTSGAFGKFVIETPILELQKHKVGYFAGIAGDEASRAGQIFVYFNQLMISALGVVVTFAAMLIFSPAFAAAVALFILVTALSILRNTKKIYRMGANVSAESRAATSTFLDGLNGLRAIRSVGGERYVVEKYGSEIKIYTRTLFMVDAMTHAQKNFPVIILLLLVLILIGLMSAATIGGFDLASALAALVLSIRLFPLAGACLSNGLKLLSDLKGSHDVVGVVTAPSLRRREGLLPLQEPIRRIELRQLTYRYQDAPAPALDGLDCRFEAGCSYAIVGPSGSGKSTLVDLLLGFIPDGAQAIHVNGLPLPQIDSESYRRRVALVEQQCRVFNDTVYNNIVFGLQVSPTQVAQVVRHAALDSVVRLLPQGLETVVDYQGSNFSGGQRQRLGIARALLRSPDVLILDESTSALDGQTRDQVLRNVMELYKDRILIIVTHDPAIMAMVDQVITLQPYPAAISHGQDAAEPAAAAS